MDAVDIALVSFKNTSPKLIGTLNYPIPDAFRQRCLRLCHSNTSNLTEYGSLDAKAGELFAKAVLELLALTQIPADQIQAIGSHGQTLAHHPEATPPFSLQIGDPNIIAERTQILTVADFRRRDIAAGGQGAPLAPGLHAEIFHSQEEDRIVLNIGGISNITCLYRDRKKPILGFDTGPGNCFLDLWTQKNWQLPFDKAGSLAKQGRVQAELLKNFLNDPYFAKVAPKSTGREYFNEAWLDKKLSDFSARNYSAEDIQATLLALTVQSIAQAILQQMPECATVYVCGGGAHNIYLLNSLSLALSRPVKTTELLGLPPDWVEGVLFAWLAKQTLEGKPSNCPSVTGAKRSVALGGIFGLEFRK